MATMISDNWAYLLEPGLRSVFMQQMNEVVGQDMIPVLFNVQSSAKASEEMLGVGGMGDVPEYKGAIEYDEFEQLYKTTFTHTEYAKGIDVERKLIDDDLYNVINQRTSLLGMSFGRTRQKHAASVFNNAFSSSYVGADAVSLCNASHPYSPTDSSTQSNAGSTALSYDSIISTRKTMREFVDNRGELLGIQPDTLLVPPELEDTAWTIVNSMNQPGTANNDGNYVRSQGWKVYVWDYLSDANNWFMLDSRMAKVHNHWFNRVMPEFAVDPTSTYDLKARYRGYMRYSYGWSDWAWIYGHEVA